MKKTILAFFAALFMLSISVVAQNLKEAKFSANMTCNTCVGKIEKALKAEAGVAKYKADLASKTVTVSYDADKTNENKIKDAIAKLGYTVENVNEIKATKTDVKSTSKDVCCSDKKAGCNDSKTGKKCSGKCN